jgi:hypothetical protein
VIVASFDRTDWTQFDFWAIAAGGGLTVVAERDRERCHQWLVSRAYQITTLECNHGVGKLVLDFNRLFRWEEQFGYSLTEESRNLNALRDGFEFDVPVVGGRVLELYRADVVWHEEADWFRGLLAIATEHSLRQLALGRRFFTTLVLPKGSALVGDTFEAKEVPWYYGPFRD